MSRSWIISAGAALAVACAGGCSDNSSGGQGTPQNDWFSTPCEEMGGTTLAAGACYVSCTEAEECPVAGMSCEVSNGKNYCALRGCRTSADCGSAGWWCCDICYGGPCHFGCTTPTAGAQSSECLEGHSCTDQGECLGITTTPTCGEPCPAGCCSPSGLTCCKPPFCSGDCAGSGCC